MFGQFPSNYPAYHFGGGGGGAAYPPQFGDLANSGPPPPPGMGSAYNVNQYGYGGGFGYNQPGAVPGFTVPAVQMCQSYSQSMGYQPPQGQVSAPVTSQLQMFDSGVLQYQLQQQQMMMQMLEKQIKSGRPLRHSKNHADEDEDEDEEEEEEDEEEGDEEKPAGKKKNRSAQPEISEEEMKEKVREQMKLVFINELIRREKVSGTFELTEGTIKPYVKYDADDPVTKWYIHQGEEDITGKKWHFEPDCRYLRDAMKGLGTNDDAIIHVVATRCNAQRQELKANFKTLYGRDLIEDIKGELSGDYKETVMALFVDPATFDAWCIKEAIYGPGTDEMALIEILMTRTNAQIKELRSVYPSVLNKHYHGKTPKIEKDIQDDTSGDFKHLLVSACQGGRYEIPKDRLEEAVEEIVNPETGQGTGMFQVNYQKLADNKKAQREAKMLFEAGEDRWGTDEETFIRIFATRDYYQLRETWNEYVKLTQRDILNSVDRETSGDFRAGLRGIVMNIRCRPMYFAEKLRAAMKGLGTDERTLIRIIVSRSEIDMVQIKACFLELTKKTLWKWLEEDTSFNFKKLLQKIVGRN